LDMSGKMRGVMGDAVKDAGTRSYAMSILLYTTATSPYFALAFASISVMIHAGFSIVCRMSRDLDWIVLDRLAGKRHCTPSPVGA
jgi:hypothetical protein